MEENFLIKNHIVQLRAGYGWPQWKLALAAKIAASRLSLLEQGCPPTKAEIEKLTKVFQNERGDIWPEDLNK